MSFHWKSVFASNSSTALTLLPVFCARKSIFNSSARRVVASEGRFETQPTLMPCWRNITSPKPSRMWKRLISSERPIKMDESVKMPSTSHKKSFTAASLAFNSLEICGLTIFSMMSAGLFLELAGQRVQFHEAREQPGHLGERNHVGAVA